MKTIVIGDLPPRFVFLHGLFGQGRNWTTIAKHLLPASSVLVDLPNHGGSEWTDRFAYDDLADTVAGLLAGLSQPLCLVGHSMGGRVAMMTALRHPELVERLVVEDTAPVALAMDEFADLADAMLAVPVASLPDRRAARAILSQQIKDERVLGFLLQSLQPRDGGGWRWIMNLEVLRRDLPQIGTWPAQAGTYDGPVLWILGDRSTRTSPAQAHAMRTYFPATVQMRVKGAGHWVHADAPAVFADALRQFAAASV